MSEEDKCCRRRSSSILKQPKSPRQALQELENNEPKAKESMQSKLERRSSRRVSFADTCQVQEFCKEITSYMSSSENHCPVMEICRGFPAAAAAPPTLQHAPPLSVLPSHHSLLFGQIRYLPLSAADTSNEGEVLSEAAVGTNNNNRAQASTNRIPLQVLNPDDFERNDAADCEESPLNSTFITASVQNPGKAELDRTIYMNESNNSMELTSADTVHSEPRLSTSNGFGVRQRTAYFDSLHDEMELTTANDFSLYVNEHHASIAPDFDNLPAESDRMFFPNDQTGTSSSPVAVVKRDDHKPTDDGEKDTELVQTSVERVDADFASGAQPASCDIEIQLPANDAADHFETKRRPSDEIRAAAGGREEKDEDMEFTEVENFSIIVSQEDVKAGRLPALEKCEIGGALSVLLAHEPADCMHGGTSDVRTGSPSSDGGVMPVHADVSMDLSDLNISKVDGSSADPLPLCSTARDGFDPAGFFACAMDLSLDEKGDPRDDAVFRCGDRSMDMLEPKIVSECREEAPANTFAKSTSASLLKGFGNPGPAPSSLAVSANHSMLPAHEDAPNLLDLDAGGRVSVGATIKFEGTSACMEFTSCTTEPGFPPRAATVARQNRRTVMFEGPSADMELSMDRVPTDALHLDAISGDSATLSRRNGEEAKCGNTSVQAAKVTCNASSGNLVPAFAEPGDELWKAGKRCAPRSPQLRTAEKSGGNECREVNPAAAGEPFASGELLSGGKDAENLAQPAVEIAVDFSTCLTSCEGAFAAHENSLTSLRASHSTDGERARTPRDDRNSVLNNETCRVSPATRNEDLATSLCTNRLMEGDAARIHGDDENSILNDKSFSVVPTVRNEDKITPLLASRLKDDDSARRPNDESTVWNHESCAVAPTARNGNSITSLRSNCLVDYSAARTPRCDHTLGLNDKSFPLAPTTQNEDSVTSYHANCLMDGDAARKRRGDKNSILNNEICSVSPTARNEDSITSVRANCLKDDESARKPRVDQNSVLNDKSCSVDPVEQQNEGLITSLRASRVVDGKALNTSRDDENSVLKDKSCSFTPATRIEAVITSLRASRLMDDESARKPSVDQNSVLNNKSGCLVPAAQNEDSITSLRVNHLKDAESARKPRVDQNSVLNDKSCSVDPVEQQNEGLITSLRASRVVDGKALNTSRDDENSVLKDKSCSFTPATRIEAVITSLRASRLMDDESARKPSVDQNSVLNNKSGCLVPAAQNEDSIMSLRVNHLKDAESARKPRGDQNSVLDDKSFSVAPPARSEGSITTLCASRLKDVESASKPTGDQNLVLKDKSCSVDPAERNEDPLASLGAAHLMDCDAARKPEDDRNFILNEKCPAISDSAAVAKVGMKFEKPDGLSKADARASSPRTNRRVRSPEELSDHPVMNSCLRKEDEIGTQKLACSSAPDEPKKQLNSPQSNESSLPHSVEMLRSDLEKKSRVDTTANRDPALLLKAFEAFPPVASPHKVEAAGSADVVPEAQVSSSQQGKKLATKGKNSDVSVAGKGNSKRRKRMPAEKDPCDVTYMIEQSGAAATEKIKDKQRKRHSAEKHQRDVIPCKQSAIRTDFGSAKADSATQKTLKPTRSVARKMFQSSAKRTIIRYGFSQEMTLNESRCPGTSLASEHCLNDDVGSQDTETAAAVVKEDDQLADTEELAPPAVGDGSFEDIMETSCPTLVSLTEPASVCADDEEERCKGDPSNGTVQAAANPPAAEPDKGGICETQKIGDARSNPAPDRFAGAAEDVSILNFTRRQQRQLPLQSRLKHVLGMTKSVAKHDFQRGDPKAESGNACRGSENNERDDAATTERDSRPGISVLSKHAEISHRQKNAAFQSRLKNMLQKMSDKTSLPKNGLAPAAERSQETKEVVTRETLPQDIFDQLKAAEQLLNSRGEGRLKALEAHLQQLKSYNLDKCLHRAKTNLRAVIDLREEVNQLKEDVKGIRIENLEVAGCIDSLELPAKERVERKPKRSVKYNVEEWTPKCIHLSFWQNVLHLKFCLGDVIDADEPVGDEENREILTVQKWSALKDDSDPTTKLAHRCMWDAFDCENLETTCRSTSRLRQILSTLIMHSENAMMLYLDVKRAGFGHLLTFRDSTVVSVDFVDLDAFLNFQLEFAIEPWTYPNQRLRPELKAIIGQISNEDLQIVLQAANVGPSYLYRLVDAVDRWLKSGCLSKS